MLAGLIWVIQIVAYPQFLRVPATEFKAYHFAHCFRIGVIVAPLILTEVGTAAWLIYQGGSHMLFIVSACLLPVIGLSTAIWQAPIHTKLMRGFDAPLIRRLILTNWVRTLAWTARGILVSLAVL